MTTCRALFTFGFVCVSLALISGCEPDPYPSEMQYPARKAALFFEVPERAPDLQTFPELGVMPQQLSNVIYKSGTGKIVPVDDVSKSSRDIIQTLLEREFGKPAQPAVFGIKTEEQLRGIFGLPGNDIKNIRPREKMVDRLYAGLMNGSKLYRRHCLHCHGVSGNGRGPTAVWMKPHPRDYLQGLFKFKSPKGYSRPLASDLYRVLVNGIEGTAMPSFRTLAPAELDSLVLYVIHLSMRGETEFQTYQRVAGLEATNAKRKDPNKISRDDIGAEFQGAMDYVISKWAQPEKINFETLSYSESKVGQALDEATDAKQKAEILKASAGRGYEVFLKEGACISCHVNFGRNSELKVDLWGSLVRPANLTQGIYRGGRRPIDIFYRIAGGIPPSGMPEAPAALKSSPDKIWDLVNFVRALPYPNMLPDEVREKIYGK